MRVLLFLCLIFNLNASPLIEGGKLIPLGDIKYIDFFKMEKHLGPECSATRVAHNKVLTAAHCVIDDKFNEIYQTGENIGMSGRIVKIAIHPRYKTKLKKINELKLSYKNEKDKNKKKLIKNEYDRVLKIKSSHDIAVITTDREKSKRTIPYPKVISKETKFSQRGDIEVVGFGDTNLSWNGREGKFEFSGKNTSGKIAKTQWITCPNAYNETQAENLANDVFGVLQIKNKVLHKITSGQESQEHSSSMILGGDSGAGVIEYDDDNNIVITAVASTMTPYADGSGSPTLIIETPSGEKEVITLSDMPKNWGDKSKANSDFSEIQEQIIKAGLDPSNKDIQITRTYTRVSTGQFADLLHPLNQAFLKENL